jgi:hypothetical protein
MSTSSSVGKRCCRRRVTSTSGRRRTPSGSLSSKMSGSSSSAATTAPTTAGTMCPTIGRNDGGVTSTPCSRSMATIPRTARRLRHAVRPGLRPHHQQGRCPTADPRTTAPPCALPPTIHRRVVQAVSSSERATPALLRRCRA